MISYAHNFEDVILERCFHHITGGFYIDCGGCTPIETNTTFGLYFHKQWAGVVVDPLFGLMQEARDQWHQYRERDILAPCCAGAEQGYTEFYICNALQMSTGSRDTVEHWKRLGSEFPPEPAIVPVVTLSQILDHHKPPDFHVLSLDVEGMEGEVLKGLDLTRHRPWVMCIEATVPGTFTPNCPWETALLAGGYDRVYQDSVNNWYLAKERQEFLPAFRFPPNQWDEIELYREVKMRAELKKAQEQITLLEDKVDKLSYRGDIA